MIGCHVSKHFANKAVDFAFSGLCSTLEELNTIYLSHLIFDLHLSVYCHFVQRRLFPLNTNFLTDKLSLVAGKKDNLQAKYP